jgi:amino acid permease
MYVDVWQVVHCVIGQGGLCSNQGSAWQPNHAPAYVAAILVFMISFNLFGVRYFGESEFCFCLVKSEIFVFKSWRMLLTGH